MTISNSALPPEPLAFFPRDGYLMKETGEWNYSVSMFPYPSVEAAENYLLSYGLRDDSFDPEDPEVDYTQISHDYVNKCPIFDLESMAGYYQTVVTGGAGWTEKPEQKFTAKVWLWNYANRNGLSLAEAEKVILDEMARQKNEQDAMRADRFARGL